MRVVFFGSPAPAIPAFEALLKAGHDVPLVVTQPDRPAGRGRRLTPCAVKRFARARGLPTIEPERIRKDENVLGRLRAANPDLQVVVAYGQIMPGPVIYLPPLHTINVHFSLLPRYRGSSPVEWAILNGETRTGVTVFELNEKMDEGDVYTWEETAIGPDETAAELEGRLAEIGADLLVRTLPRLRDLPRLPQDHTRATYARKITKEDGLLVWADEATVIDRKVRAFHPWPSAFTFQRGKRLIIHRGRPLPDPIGDRPAGEVFEASKEGLAVACGNRTAYRITSLQLEGRPTMDAYAFSLGGGIRPGDVLGSV
ncbi:MAG: methionyl-tRNA formyltransferase [Candidatus Aminicenantes bacterium]|nr:methionyl-tRNA formyltransferase [Candidatus Aminicenantes bacterium]